MKLFLVIVGMAVVTYIPRTIPLILGQRLVLPPALKRWLELIPYSALGALIFPGILTSTEAPWIAAVAGAIAFMVAFVQKNILVVFLTAVVVVYLLGG